MRLIDPDALKEALDEQMNNFEENCRDSVFDIINNAPTVEQERPYVIDNCDMNVFEPEKYMRGKEE